MVLLHARAGHAAFQEPQRRGLSSAKPNVYREADRLAELGFLTVEQSKDEGSWPVKNRADAGRKYNVMER